MIGTGLATPRRFRGWDDIAKVFDHSSVRKIFNTLVITIYLLDIIIPDGDSPERLLALPAAYSSVPYDRMGFPSEWREFTIWKKHLPQAD